MLHHILFLHRQKHDFYLRAGATEWSSFFPVHSESANTFVYRNTQYSHHSGSLFSNYILPPLSRSCNSFSFYCTSTLHIEAYHHNRSTTAVQFAAFLDSVDFLLIFPNSVRFWCCITAVQMKWFQSENSFSVGVLHEADGVTVRFWDWNTRTGPQRKLTVHVHAAQHGHIYYDKKNPQIQGCSLQASDRCQYMSGACSTGLFSSS